MGHAGQLRQTGAVDACRGRTRGRGAGRLHERVRRRRRTANTVLTIGVAFETLQTEFWVAALEPAAR